MTASKPSFAIVVPTVYGSMIVNRYDINQTNALIKTGAAIDHSEIDLLVRLLAFLGADRCVLDIGANFGTYALALSSVLQPGGRIHAFEAQRLIFNMLAGSVALNALENVYCHNMAIGDREGSIEVPQFDYFKELNFGSIEFGKEQRERLTQQRGHDPKRSEHVQLRTIDGFGFTNVALMKVDVEGMEMAVLEGARETIARCRPVLYVEFLKSDRDALSRRLTELSYVLHVRNVNYLCVPKELTDRIRLEA